MKTKRTFLTALVMTALSLAGLAGIASAAEVALHNQANGVPGAFTGKGGAGTLTAEGQKPVSCTEGSGAGKFTSMTTGEIELTLKGCSSEVSGSKVNCTSSGQATGVITTNTAVVHGVELEPNPAIEPLGVLITGPAGGFAKFVCGGLQTVTLTGNLIGEVTGKNCNSAKSKSMEINFTTKAGATEPTQKWEQVTTTGTVYDLTSDFTGFPTNSANVTSAIDVEVTGTLTADEATPTCA
jgi:hypothetical protein